MSSKTNNKAAAVSAVQPDKKRGKLYTLICENGVLHFLLAFFIPSAIMLYAFMKGLSDEEVPAYVRHKIRAAGGSDQIINEAAMSALNSMSQNNPRVIDNIMSDALTIAMQTDKHTIDADVILAAVNHQSFA